MICKLVRRHFFRSDGILWSEPFIVCSKHLLKYAIGGGAVGVISDAAAISDTFSFEIV